MAKKDENIDDKIAEKVDGEWHMGIQFGAQEEASEEGGKQGENNDKGEEGENSVVEVESVAISFAGNLNYHGGKD